MLVKGKFSKQMYKSIKDANANPIDLKDIDKSIKAHCDLMENLLYEAIKSIVITIPPGSIITVGSAVTQTNTNPIVLNLTVK